MAPLYLKCDAFELMRALNCPLAFTTNGFVKKNGEAVMGRGIAKEVATHFPRIPRCLGDSIKYHGNHVQILRSGGIPTQFISFPVKPTHRMCMPGKDEIVEHMRDKFSIGDVVPGWACKAELGIILTSCRELMNLIVDCSLAKVVLNFPGIGAGELKYEDVKAILDHELDLRVTVVTKS
jgi:hypothetical protein